MRKPTYKQLELELLELRSGSLYAYWVATQQLNKLTSQDYTGSGLIIEIKKLDGSHVLSPVLMRDTLCPDTINGLKIDVARSKKLASLYATKES